MKLEDLAEAAMSVPFNMPGAGGLRGQLHMTRGQARSIARAILNRLREPSPEMKMAGAEAITAETMKAMANYDAMLDCWLAMLSAIDEKEG